MTENETERRKECLIKDISDILNNIHRPDLLLRIYNFVKYLYLHN